jgi:hypothetical protein
MLPTVKIAKIVRETAGLNPWNMYKRMGKKSVQAYLSLERSAKRISLKDLYALERIWVDEGCGTREQFHERARKCVE